MDMKRPRPAREVSEALMGSLRKDLVHRRSTLTKLRAELVAEDGFCRATVVVPDKISNVSEVQIGVRQAAPGGALASFATLRTTRSFFSARSMTDARDPFASATVRDPFVSASLASARSTSSARRSFKILLPRRPRPRASTVGGPQALQVIRVSRVVEVKRVPPGPLVHGRS